MTATRANPSPGAPQASDLLPSARTHATADGAGPSPTSDSGDALDGRRDTGRGDAWSAPAAVVRRHGWLVPASIVCLAVALRLLHVHLSARLLVADDAVFFERHAVAFLDAWRAAGTPLFLPALKEAIDHASLQGVLYPLTLSAIYAAAGGIDHRDAATVQALMGGVTVWLTYLTARRAFGATAGGVAGFLAAVYPPLVLTSGLLLAEATLALVQAVAAYLIVRGLSPAAGWSRFGGGVAIGVLMLRPAFQHAGPIVLAGLLLAVAVAAGTRPLTSRFGHLARTAAPYIAGVLVVALPWVTLNGVVYGAFGWSRTGDAWQQVYWGIYPPNRGWWPPDSPVPPKYGVDSLPGAWAAGMAIAPRDLDYLEAAIDQVRATPLKALATEVNKLYQAYLHPFNTYGEAPVGIAPLAVPLHRFLALAALAGLALWWRRPAPALALASLTFAVALPFLVSHIDVRYVIPVALAGTAFAGLAAAEAWARFRRSPAGRWQPAVALALPFVTWAVGVPQLVRLAPGLAPVHAHYLQATLMCLALMAGGVLLGRWLGASAPVSTSWSRSTWSGLAAGAALAATYGIQAHYDGGWREWSATIRPGEEIEQTLVVPPDWRPPAGGRAEVRFYAQGSPGHTYEPVLYAGSTLLARLGPAFTEGGPLRFEEQIMVAASRQGKGRADVPQWYGVPLPLEALSSGSVAIRVAVEPLAGQPAASAWVRVWGDYPPDPHARVYDGPSLHSAIQGKDDSFHKFVATGHGRLWRRVSLASVRAEPVRRVGGRLVDDDLSPDAGRQTGEYRIRVLVFGPAGDLQAVF